MDVRTFDARVLRRLVPPIATALLLVGCAAAPPPTVPPAIAPTPTPPATLSPVVTGPFPTKAFAAISQEPVPAELAADLRSVLDGLDIDAGMSVTVMSARGTWSGARGTADGVRKVTIHDQFSIASVTKAVTAAQVMQLVEQGRLGLDDLAADHLPDLDFDMNGATIRDLLGHRSGIPDYLAAVTPEYTFNPLRRWTPAELLAMVPKDRKPAAESDYANTNYLLLGLIVEQVTGKPFAKVLRAGVLDLDGVERLIFQPEEKPTDPIAIDDGRSTDYLESVGGYLPSLALTSDWAAGAMASDSVSLANWWRALCAGEIVSGSTLTRMVSHDDWYGLGLESFGEFRPPNYVGHYGQDAGGVAFTGCVPETGVVFVILANRDGSTIQTSVVGRFTSVIGAP